MLLLTGKADCSSNSHNSREKGEVSLRGEH